MAVLPFKGSRIAWIPASYNRPSWTRASTAKRTHLSAFFRAVACWRLLKYEVSVFLWNCLGNELAVLRELSHGSSSFRQCSFMAKLPSCESATGSGPLGSLCGYKHLCLNMTAFSGDQNKIVVLVLFIFNSCWILVLETIDKLQSQVMVLGMQNANFLEGKNHPLRQLLLAVMCAPVAWIIRMVSSLALLRKGAWLTWFCIFFFIFAHILAVEGLFDILGWCFMS